MDKKIIFSLVAIILATIICYANSLHNPFIWDQEVIILGNPLIRSWGNLPLIFKTNVEGRPLTGISFYRPMEVISYMLDYTFWRFNPTGYHLSSIFLHICNSLLLFRILWKIGLERRVSFLSSIIFAIHPLNTESVTYSIRGDLLGALFSLLCFLPFLFIPLEVKRQRRLPDFWLGLLTGLTYILALLSKESTVVLPGIILVYSILFCRTKKTIRLSAMLLLISVIYIFIRFNFISTSAHQPLSLISEAAFSQRILTAPRIILTYIRLLVFPLHLHMEYHFVEKNLLSPYVWGGGLFLCAIGYFLFKCIKTMAGLKNIIIFFSVWFFIGLAPFYNIIVPLHATLTEHWAYFPGIGFITLSAVLGSQIFQKLNSSIWPRRLVLLGVIILSGYYGFYTIKRNWEWGDAMRLYQHDLRYEPRSFVLHNNVGVVYFRRGDFKGAKEAFLKAIEVSPGRRYDVAYNNLGVIYENEGNIPAAENAYKKSIELNNYELAYGNLSRLYLKSGKIEKAIQISERGRELYPLNPEINYYLKHLYSGILKPE